MITPDSALSTALFDTLADPVLLVDLRDGWQVQAANPAAVHSLGLHVGDRLAQALPDLWPELATYTAELTDLRAGEVRLLSLHGTGEWRWVSVRAFPVGSYVGLHLVNRAQAQLLDLAQDAVIVRTPTSQVKYWNPAAQALYGFSFQEAQGQVTHDLLRTRFPVSREALDEALLTGNVWEGELQHTTQDGQEVTVISRQTLQRSASGEPEAILEINRDVTARVLADRRARVLSDVTAALARPLTHRDVLQTVLEHALPALGAYAGVFMNISVDGQAIEVEQATGYEDSQRRTWQRYALDLPLPATVCVRENRVVLVSEADLMHDFPSVASMLSERTRSLAALPLRFGGRVMGALLLSFDENRRFGDVEQQFMGDIAGQCAVALERAQVFEQERTAQDRAFVLAQAGERLSMTREPQKVLDVLAGLVAPGLADWCNILLPDGTGHLQLVAIGHADPERVRLVRQYRQRVPVRINVQDDHLVAQVVRSGQAMLLPRVDNEAALRPAGVDDPEFTAVLDATNARSLMLVPLITRGEVLGVISFISGTPDRFGPGDLAFAQELARRAALALDNARLYEAVFASEERYRALIEATNQYVWTTSPEGQMLGEQPGWVRLTGQTPEEYAGDGWASRLHPNDRVHAVEVWQESVRTRSLYELEERVQVAGGSYRSFLVRATPLLREDGSVREWVGLHTDVTDLKRAELMLKAWGSELERQVTAQTRELRAANEELGAFAYTVSHDLRTPIRHIGSFAGLLRKKVNGGDESAVLRYLDVIEQAAHRMETMIDALLGLARAGAAELKMSEVALHLLVDAVRSDLAPDLAGRQVTWQVGALPTVWADVRLLRQVLTNLLGNAVKYSSGREESVVEVWSEPTPTEVIVAVRDNGAGFDPQYAGKLFGVFQRLHSQQEFAGTGVGLANVRRIVEKHGGRVWAEGRPGEGATFFFSLPQREGSGQTVPDRVRT